jgi:hypothetical protein
MGHRTPQVTEAAALAEEIIMAATVDPEEVRISLRQANTK